MFQSKEHLIRTSDPSLWGFAGLDLNADDHNRKLVVRIWKVLNSRLFNGLIVVLVLLDTFVIVSQVLIDSHWIQDPNWRPLSDCTNNTNTTDGNTTSSIQLSPTLITTRHFLTYISLTIISFFFIEVLFRIYSGKSKLFVQPFDLLDAILVNIVFVLSLVFYLHDFRDKSGGKEATLLIIVLRLWRVFQIIKSVIDESQQKMIQTLNVCEKERTHCEHKIDILILRVEDLEHEVAYLKEKLKKTEKDNSAYIQQLIDAKPKKLNAKRTQSSQSYCPCRKDSFKNTPKPQTTQTTVKQKSCCSQVNYTLVNIESQPLVSKQVIIENSEKVHDLDVFAKNLAQSITIDVMNAVIDKTNGINGHSIDSISDCLTDAQNTTEINLMQSLSNKTPISPSSSHLPYNQFINNSLIKSSICNGTDIYTGLHHNHITDQSIHYQPNESKKTATFESSCAAHQLNNDDPEVDHIKKVDFNINDRDIPLSSL